MTSNIVIYIIVYIVYCHSSKQYSSYLPFFKRSMKGRKRLKKHKCIPSLFLIQLKMRYTTLPYTI